MFLCINVRLLDEDEKRKKTDTKTCFQFVESMFVAVALCVCVSLHIQFVVNIAKHTHRQIQLTVSRSIENFKNEAETFCWNHFN